MTSSASAPRDRDPRGGERSKVSRRSIGAPLGTVRLGHLEGNDEAFARLKRVRIAFILMPRFTLLALAGFLDSLRLAADVGDRGRPIACDWVIVAPDQNSTTSSCGIDVRPWGQLGSPSDYDYVVVVGGLYPSTYDLDVDSRIIDYIRCCDRHGARLIGLCVGTYALAVAGVLKGRQVCVHMYHEEDFRSEFPTLLIKPNVLFAVDGNIITCAGGAAAIDVACHIIAEHFGADRAIKILHHFLVDRLRGANAPQLACADGTLGMGDRRVRRALAVMERYRESPISMQDLAGRVGVSPRQLERVFHSTFSKSPSEYYRSVRVRHGRWMMFNTNKTLGEIAFHCGFADTSHFARCFKSEFGCSPREMRITAQNATPAPSLGHAA